MAETRTQKDQARGLQRSERDLPAQRRRDPFDPFGIGPFSLMRRMTEDMDRLFGEVCGGHRQWPGSGGEGSRGEWAPAIETFQRGSDFVIRAEVPGLSRDDLSVEIGDDAMTIQGERKDDHQEEREGVYRSERSYGTFCRVVPLPDGAVPESAKANFKDGVLEIVVQAPSHEARRGRRIEIGQESSEHAKDRR